MKSCIFCERLAENDFFCECGKVLPSCWDNIFKLFGLESKFNVDISSLQRKYYSIITILHPDKFHSSPYEERKLAQEHSSFVNSAYKQIKDPWKRGEALLNILNYPLPEEVEQSVLLEVMELNSIVNNIEKLKRAKDTELKLLKNLEKAFSVNDLDKASKIILHFKFIKRSINWHFD